MGERGEQSLTHNNTLKIFLKVRIILDVSIQFTDIIAIINTEMFFKKKLMHGNQFTLTKITHND